MRTPADDHYGATWDEVIESLNEDVARAERYSASLKRELGDCRSALLAAESRAERLESALRGLLYCLNAGYPCTAEMDIARAALAEGAVVSGEAPGGEGKPCPGCGGLGWIPAGDEQWGCCDCNGTGHARAALGEEGK